MDKIRLNKMAFFGRHGLFEEEAKLGQRFIIDLTLELDLLPAGLSDKMEDSVHYGEVYETVRKIVEEQRFNLLEALAQAISQGVLAQDSRIRAVEVSVQKPSVPIPGILENAEVVIRRQQNG